MPNFWTRTVQKIKESIKGPRTNDKDLMDKIEETVQVERAMGNMKKIIDNFTTYFEKIMSYNREISECIFLLFNKNKEYKEFANILTAVHVDNNSLFQTIINDINTISKETQGWDNYYYSIKSLIDEREESRKVYDHYEKKLEKLEDKKEIKIKEGNYFEGSDFYNEVTRNETKYINAKDEYVKKAILAYDTIEKLNNDRFNILTPVLLNLFFIEMKLYESFSTKYNEYKDIEEKLQKMRYEFFRKPKNIYNPMNFTKSPHLSEKFDNSIKKRDIKSSSPNIKRKKSFKKEELVDENKNFRNKLRKMESKEIREEDYEKEGDEIYNFEKIRSGSHYVKKPSKQMKNNHDLTMDEFNKIGNQFSNEFNISHNHIIRNDTIQSQINKNERIPTNFANFPTFTSVINENFVSRKSSIKTINEEDNNNIKNNSCVENTIKLSSHSNNQKLINTKLCSGHFNFDANFNYHLQNQQNIIQTNQNVLNNKTNFFNDMNKISSLKNSDMINPISCKQIPKPNRICSIGVCNNIESRANIDPNYIDFNELLKSGCKEQNTSSINVNTSKKIDPFEGFFG